MIKRKLLPDNISLYLVSENENKNLSYLIEEFNKLNFNFFIGEISSSLLLSLSEYLTNNPHITLISTSSTVSNAEFLDKIKSKNIIRTHIMIMNQLNVLLIY